MAKNQDAASFWGLKLTNGLNYSTVVNQAFRISAAALDFQSEYKKGVISVIFENQGQEHVLCNLSADHNILQVPLDLQFCEEDKLCFSLRGASGGVYLTGYYLTDADDLGFEDEDSDEGADSDGKRRVDALEWVQQVSQNEAKKSKSAKNTPVNQKRKQPQDTLSAKKAKTGVFSSLSELMNGDHHSEDDDDFEVDEDILDDEESYDEFDEDELLDEAKKLMNGDHSDEEEDDESQALPKASKQSRGSVQSSPATTPGKVKTKKNKLKTKKDSEATPVANGKTPKAQKTPVGGNKSPQNIKTPVGQNKSPRNVKTPRGENKSPKNVHTPGENKVVKKVKTPGDKKTPTSIGNTPTSKIQKTPKSAVTPTPKSSSKKVKLAGGKVEVQDMVVGTGKQAHSGNYVGLYYEARLKAHNKLVEKVDSGRPFRFRLGANEVMKGWDVAISGMKVGGKRCAVINPSMAYGNVGVPNSIPPNSILNFEFNLLEVN